MIDSKNKKLTPTEYFNKVKEKRKTITDKDLQELYDSCMGLYEKYKATGQISGMKRLIFQLETNEKERDIVKAGINTFVYRDDIEDYINDIADKAVKIIEVERYEREIPDEIIESMLKVKDLFDQIYIVFTDYTGEVEKKVAKERRDKDPIMFGAFKKRADNDIAIHDRFYYIGDWEDEYCDLTLEKMVNQSVKKKSKNIVRTIGTPRSLKELKAELELLEQSKKNPDKFIMTERPKKRFDIFRKVKTFLGVK